MTNHDRSVLPSLDPNRTMAEDILKALLAECLVPEDKKDEVLSKLAKGTATQDDWKLWLDLPLMKKEAGR